ncbi:TOBE domain-containing protein [Paraburkholderia mimosarum]|uniref:TOBE domain-containing protein n=2 Tax=Burkholderiaceae TaxID=119060 RepID=UPI001FC89AF3|nr:TOBE domain-containing protein [Paraburkholderia mimosarum]
MIDQSTLHSGYQPSRIPIVFLRPSPAAGNPDSPNAIPRGMVQPFATPNPTRLQSMDIRTTRIRNQLQGRIVSIIRGAVHSEVDVVTAAGLFTSVVETELLDLIGLKAGSAVVATVKSSDVKLAAA